MFDHLCSALSRGSSAFQRTSRAVTLTIRNNWKPSFPSWDCRNQVGSVSRADSLPLFDPVGFVQPQIAPIEKISGTSLISYHAIETSKLTFSRARHGGSKLLLHFFGSVSSSLASSCLFDVLLPSIWFSSLAVFVLDYMADRFEYKLPLKLGDVSRSSKRFRLVCSLISLAEWMAEVKALEVSCFLHLPY